jgi:ankyrin repeat protein
MIAAFEGHTEITRTLVEAGADKRLRNKRRETAADIAVAAGHLDIAKLLE